MSRGGMSSGGRDELLLAASCLTCAEQVLLTAHLPTPSPSLAPNRKAACDRSHARQETQRVRWPAAGQQAAACLPACKPTCLPVLHLLAC